MIIILLSYCRSLYKFPANQCTSKAMTSGPWLMQDWDQQTSPQIITELCGFVTILSGTFLLHATKDMGDTTAGLSSYTTPVLFWIVN